MARRGDAHLTGVEPNQSRTLPCRVLTELELLAGERDATPVEFPTARPVHAALLRLHLLVLMDLPGE